MTDQTSSTGELGPEQPSERNGSVHEHQEPRTGRSPRTDEHGVPYGIGPFSLREIVFFALTAITLLASFLPIVGGVFVDFPQSLWVPFGWFVIPGLLLMFAAAVLMLLRRLVPSVTWRVGSLSVDQFASVATVATAAFFLGVLLFVASLPGILGVLVVPGAGIILGLVASVLALGVTTFAVFIPPFRDDFARRDETRAHIMARPVAPVARRPKPEQVEETPFQDPAAGFAEAPGYDPYASPYPATTQPEPVGPRYARRSGTWQDESRSIDDDAVPGREDPGLWHSAPADAPVAQVVQEEPAVADTSRFGGAIADPDETETTRFEPGALDPSASLAEQSGDGAPGDVASVSTGETSVAPDTGAGATGEEPERDVAMSDTGEESDDLSIAVTGQPDDQTTGADATTRRVDEDALPADELFEELHPEGSFDEEQSTPRSAFSHVSAAFAKQDDEGDAARETPPPALSTQPFWVYSAVPRTVVDEVSGAPLFQIGPTAWALAIVDRGSELVIRHDDGRVGVLKHVDGLLRG